MGKGKDSGKPEDLNISRERMIELLNEDLSREYQAIIAYVVYSKMIKGAAFTDIAGELEAHASEELDHALKIAQQIDYLGGTPVTTPKPVKMSEKAEDMLRFDLENERETVANYRQRIRQAEAMGEAARRQLVGHGRIRPIGDFARNHRPGAGAPNRPG